MSDQPTKKTDVTRRATMTWARLVKQVFEIDIETCSECGDAVRVITCIEDLLVIQKILAQVKNNTVSMLTALLPEGGAPPAGWFG